MAIVRHPKEAQSVRRILGKAKSVRELMKGVKYRIDYYQREYKWGEKQIRELIDDLCNKFSEEHDPENPRKMVAKYPHYFLGSIIITEKNNALYIVDGQQRLTSLTLLLTLLRNLQGDKDSQVNVDELILSDDYGEMSFNLHVDERIPAMKALYEGKAFDATGNSESVQTLVQRYRDLERCFPDELKNEALPYFIDWLLRRVYLVEITASSDDDAYTIFETMNDRGLSLSPTDMLKGYLLSKMDDRIRTLATERWRARVRDLSEEDQEVETDCFKAWFRSQYAKKTRERKKGAQPEDFERIGTEYHRWLRDSAKSMGLVESADYYRFVDRDFDFYSRQYLRIIKAGKKQTHGLERVRFNAQHGFTLQYMLLLSPLRTDDDQVTIDRKIGVVAQYLDILLAWRLWNFRSISYSTMQYTMFHVMKDIRGLEYDALAELLYNRLGKEAETFDSNDHLRMHQQNRYALHRLLARITDYVEVASGMPSHYVDYVNDGIVRFEVEHIWADHWDRHEDEFSHPADFAQWRSRIGGLLILPKSTNASYGDLSYEEKLPYYNAENLLARSLHPQCYEHNPGFLRFRHESGLPFTPHAKFDTAALEQRCELYRQIANRIWNRNDLLNGVLE